MKRIKLKVKKGDTVQMRAGKDKGKRGRVLVVYPLEGKAIVEGLNLVKKHKKPRRSGQKGEMVLVPRAVDVSNVTVVCPKCSQPGRVGFAVVEGNRVRVCKKCKGQF